MSLPLSNASELSMRKDLVRLRMEMHRQQLLYNAQPLANPMQQVKGMIASRTSGAGRTVKGPAMLTATVLLTLFGRRLGKVGRFARLALALYPMIQAGRQMRKHGG